MYLETESCYIAWIGLGLVIFLPQPPKYCIYVSPYSNVFLVPIISTLNLLNDLILQISRLGNWGIETGRNFTRPGLGWRAWTGQVVDSAVGILSFCAMSWPLQKARGRERLGPFSIAILKKKKKKQQKRCHYCSCSQLLFSVCLGVVKVTVPVSCLPALVRGWPVSRGREGQVAMEPAPAVNSYLCGLILATLWEAPESQHSRDTGWGPQPTHEWVERGGKGNQ